MLNKTRHIPIFGIKVKKRLIELNMTQRQLAKHIGVNENYLTDILNGRRSGKKYIEPIAKSLGLDDEEKKQSNQIKKVMYT